MKTTERRSTKQVSLGFVIESYLKEKLAYTLLFLMSDRVSKEWSASTNCFELV